MKKECTIFAENSELQDTSCKGLMSALLAIPGCKATAILTSDGEVLYDNTPPETSGNFGAWITAFNSLFDHTCSLSETSGFLACQQVSMRTGEEIVIIRGSGQNCRVGIRLLVIIDHRGNEALIHQKLDQLLPPLMQRLTWDPDNLTFLSPENMRHGAVCRPRPAGKNGSLPLN